VATADVSTTAKMSAATTTKMTAAATAVAAATLRQSVNRDRGASEPNRSDDNRDFVQLETSHWIYH